MRVCSYCNKEYEPIRSSRFCSKIHGGYSWKMNNRDRYLRNTRRNQAERKRIWGSVWSGFRDSDNPIFRRAEEIAATSILPREGFKDIFWVSEINSKSIFDILARKNGETYAINVTTSYKKHANRQTVEIIEYLGLRHLILFVSPDLQSHFFRELRGGQRTSGLYNRDLLQMIRKKHP